MTARGATLIELVVVLLVLGVGASLVAPSLFLSGPGIDEAKLAPARDSALRYGTPVRVVIPTPGDSAPLVILYLPDGRVIGDASVDPLSGDPHARP